MTRIKVIEMHCTFLTRILIPLLLLLSSGIAASMSNTASFEVENATSRCIYCLSSYENNSKFESTEGWRDAGMLKQGDKLLLKDADSNAEAEHTVGIADIRTEQKVLPVFNLEVANAHTFFVGANGVLVHNGFGSYTCTFKSGMKYHGKGDFKRAKKSGKDHAQNNNDPLDNIDWKAAKNDKDSFSDEARRIANDGGIRNPNNYNRINSPGAKYK